MRIKDELKQDAIIKATVKLVNQIGFAACSVAKIAKEANVSPATLYIYYKNKEDLLVSTYIDIKKRVSLAMLKEFDASRPIRDIFKKVWLNAYKHISAHPEDFQFAEQFSNSPYSELINKVELDKHFEPMIRVIKKGIEQKIIKDVPIEMLSAFIFTPLMIIANPKMCHKINVDSDTIDTAFTLAWDAIKL